MIDEKFIKQFNIGGLSLMIIKNNRVLFSDNRDGISPLLNAIEEIGLSKLKKSFVIDKIVGKASALCISYFEAGYVYAKIMSRLGMETLTNSGVEHMTEKIVDKIKMKDGLETCPFEKAVSRIENPEQGYLRIKQLLQTKGK